MSPSGGIMTRRSFNPDLLPKAPPSKEAKKAKVVQRRFVEIKDFFDLYITLSRGKYVRKKMAAACNCSTQSVSHWRHGTPPGRTSHTLVAKYFATITGVSRSMILSDLEFAYHTGFQRWYAEEEEKKKKETDE